MIASSGIWHVFSGGASSECGCSKTEGSPVRIGCQGCVQSRHPVGGNFGAFTSNRPASAMVAAGCETTINRTLRKEMIRQEFFTEAGVTDTDAVNRLLNQEIKCAIARGMKVLYCIGERAKEGAVAGKYLEDSLRSDLKRCKNTSKVVIAYEPIWSIGPGKTPAGKEYITKIAKFVKERQMAWTLYMAAATKTG